MDIEIFRSELKEELGAIRGDIAQLRQDMNHYRGFVGGILWCISGMAGAVGFIWGFVGGRS